MIIDSHADAISAVISLVVGLLICFIYDIFKSLRYVYKSSIISIFIQDILFSIMTSFITFLLLFVCVKGEIRLFILFFELTGFLIYKYTISSINIKVLNKLNIFLKKVLFKPIKKLLFNIDTNLNLLIEKIFNIFFKKSLKRE